MGFTLLALLLCSKPRRILAGRLPRGLSSDELPTCPEEWISDARSLLVAAMVIGFGAGTPSGSMPAATAFLKAINRRASSCSTCTIYRSNKATGRSTRCTRKVRYLLDHGQHVILEGAASVPTMTSPVATVITNGDQQFGNIHAENKRRPCGPKAAAIQQNRQPLAVLQNAFHVFFAKL